MVGSRPGHERKQREKQQNKENMYFSNKQFLKAKKKFFQILDTESKIPVAATSFIFTISGSCVEPGAVKSQK